jgi:hypothetical protein
VLRRNIVAALEYAGGSHTADDIIEAIGAGKMQSWVGDESAVITEVRETPQRKLLMFFLAGGNLRELEAMLPPILEWGRSIGCQEARLVGRAGWQRTFLARQGWRVGGTIMECDLG